MSTTIQISDGVRKILERMKLFERESFNEVLERIIEDDLEINKRTKKELIERAKSPNLISHEEAKRRLGL